MEERDETRLAAWSWCEFLASQGRDRKNLSGVGAAWSCSGCLSVPLQYKRKCFRWGGRISLSPVSCRWSSRNGTCKSHNILSTKRKGKYLCFPRDLTKYLRLRIYDPFR